MHCDSVGTIARLPMLLNVKECSPKHPLSRLHPLRVQLFDLGFSSSQLRQSSLSTLASSFHQYMHHQFQLIPSSQLATPCLLRSDGFSHQRQIALHHSFTSPHCFILLVGYSMAAKNDPATIFHRFGSSSSILRNLASLWWRHHKVSGWCGIPSLRLRMLYLVS